MENSIIHVAWAAFWAVVVIRMTKVAMQENEIKKEIELAKINKGKK